MFEESVSSSPTFWSSLTSWFTPTIFFLLLQLVIATICIISSLSNNNNNNATHKHHQHEQQDHHETNHFQQQPLARSPSLLHRLKSINFYTYYPHHTHETQQPQQYHQQHQHEQYPHETNDFQQQPLARSPSLLQRLKSINFYSYYPHHTYETQQPQHHHHQQQQPPQQKQPQLPRSPSSVLQRLKSINLHTYFPTEPFSSYFTHEKTLEQPQKKTFGSKTPVLETEQKHKEEQEQEQEQEDDDDDVVGEMFQNNNHEVHHDDEGSCASMGEIFSKLQQGQGGNFTRSHSDTKPESGEVPVRLPRKMKKSASTKSAFSHFEEGDIVESHRPAAAREGGAAVDDGDGGVDAKADDFINRFKQQLKLQRLDSIMRYKEMIGRGSGN